MNQKGLSTVETTELDGTIEGAISSIVAPEEEEQDTSPEETPEEETEVEATTDDELEESDDEEEAVEEEDAAEDDDSDEPLYSVKIDGKEVQVSLDELTRGYSGQQYVQKGMREAAAARKEAEKVYYDLLQSRKEVLELANKIGSGQMLKPPVEPPRELLESDPFGYMEAKFKYDDEMANYQKEVASLQQLDSKQRAAQEQAQKVYMAREADQLKAVIPEFGDGTKAKELREGLISAANDYGYAAEEIGNIMDHRALHVLHDAMKYRELKAGTNKAKAKSDSNVVIKKAAKKPTNTKTKQRQKQQDKLKRSGSIEDALGLIMNI